MIQLLAEKVKQDGLNSFYPQVIEEVFVVDENSGEILNYVAFVESSSVSLIDMLDGPTAAGFSNQDDEEDGYRSQEIFTQEKFAYLFYKGILLLEHLYNQGL